jgi:type II secretory pathway component PulF
MSRFSFKAKNTLGQLVEGQRAAGSDKEVVALLKGEGLIAFSITEIREGVVSREKKKKETGRGGAIRQQEIAVFCRQLATLVNAGVSILDAIEDISDIVTNLRFQSILKGIATTTSKPLLCNFVTADFSMPSVASILIITYFIFMT